MNQKGSETKPGTSALDQIPGWLTSWIESVRTKYRLPQNYDEALTRILEQIKTKPESVVALEVGRLLYFFERNRMVTEKTPLADKAIQLLIEIGRAGSIDKETGELRQWFRRHYLWATSTVSLDIKTLHGDEADEIMKEYFKGDPGPNQKK